MKKSARTTSELAWAAARPSSSSNEPETGATSALRGGAFSDLDRHFAQLIERLAGRNQPELALAAALVSLHRSEGHICLDLASVAGKPWPETPDDDVGRVVCPDLSAWLKKLRATLVVGAPGEFKPLILDAQARLYLHRYWEYETALATEIKRRAHEPSASFDEKHLNECLSRLFPASANNEPDWQKIAALTALRKNFCVISGGPGTGKTRTLARILALLLETSGGRLLRFAVAAPTGKAAARIQDELRKAKEQLPCADAIKAQLPEDAKTLHRLLEAQPDSATFRRNAKNPLAADVVVVDEASMVDLALMAKLFDATPRAAKIILLGDKDQLASVEAGAVLGDICGTWSAEREARSGSNENSLADCIVQLRKNYRFAVSGAIYRLSEAINNGDANQSSAILDEGARNGGEVSRMNLPGPAELKVSLKETLLAGFGPYLAAKDPRAALEALGRFRILCAVREGPYGVAHLNELAGEILEEAGLIRRNRPWYGHRPVMVTRNDYGVKLFNGDTGCVLPGAETGEARAFFIGAENELRPILPARLPPHETVFAMTVHKSQGSEFENVLLILPDRDSPLLTRELLYTGLTRARSRVELWSNEAVLRAAISRRATRHSGLRDALWPVA